MSLALIEESAKEVRRLAIAGSPLAVNDFRLKKLIPPLEQAGAKVPVFTQVANSISELVKGTEAESAQRLLNLSTLLNAILYTQGQSEADGDYRELESFATRCFSTRTTARVLKPLIEALTSSGAGRFEMIKTACDQGVLNDLRLIDPAIQALGDNYPELADLIAEKVLPSYGPGIVPRLRAALDLKGKKADARKLKLLHQLDPGGTLELCKMAIEDGSPEVKASAVSCLGKHEDCLPLVLEQSNSRNKIVRAAALEALAEHDRPEITKLFGELIKGKALDILAGPFRAMRNRKVVNSLIEEGRRTFDLLLKGDASARVRHSEILDCLQERKDPETEEFLLTCFNQCERIPKAKRPKNSFVVTLDLLDRLATLLYQLGSPRALEAILAKRDVLPPASFTQVLLSAARTWPASRVYDEFASLLGQEKGAGKQKGDLIEHIIRASGHGYVPDSDALAGALYNPEDAQALKGFEWDSRWLDAAIRTGRQTIVCCLAQPGHRQATAYLLKAVETKGQSETGLIIRALARCQYPKLTDLFLELAARKTMAAKYSDYGLELLFMSARYLPAADLPRLDAFAARLDEKFLDKYLEALEPLRRARSDLSD